MAKHYFDSCPECDSLNVEVVDEEKNILTVCCRECGADWVDFSEDPE